MLQPRGVGGCWFAQQRYRDLMHSRGKPAPPHGTVAGAYRLKPAFLRTASAAEMCRRNVLWHELWHRCSPETIHRVSYLKYLLTGFFSGSVRTLILQWPSFCNGIISGLHWFPTFRVSLWFPMFAAVVENTFWRPYCLKFVERKGWLKP